MNKYRAKKANCLYGHTHDSRKEARRCNELHLLQKAGAIKGLEVQKRFELLPMMRYPGMPTERRVDYVADFVYIEDGKIVIEDTKGYRTKDYILKRKMLKYRYCLEGKAIFREI